MRHPEPFKPGRPARKFELYMALGTLSFLLGVAFAILYFHDRGFLGIELSIAAMTFTAAVCIGIVVGLTIEWSTQRRTGARTREIPPPFDIYSVWPPASDSFKSAVSKDQLRPKEKQGSRLRR
ncbi:hypothetical protein M527_15170 [Sphingobium indicum IP26]|uniref:Uncharacterized protein n=1 Tax=Sphingobium indicum F2 TaxID=1450518 RepID=A0A8E0WQD3_9SPHN|nr:hypothetical protein M527_15170 [Sphingobium indicum IP26]KER35310.1 hypothetical protein AL00_17170 [Sphingobium indicum F2]